jgi:hypothetical protein
MMTMSSAAAADAAAGEGGGSLLEEGTLEEGAHLVYYALQEANESAQ